MRVPLGTPLVDPKGALLPRLTVAANGTVGVQASWSLLLPGLRSPSIPIKRSTRVTAWTLVGLGLVYGGVGVNAFAASSLPRFTAASALFLLLCALAGAGYALLALRRDGKDIGRCAPRASRASC